jgi:hypothetical protein
MAGGWPTTLKARNMRSFAGNLRPRKNQVEDAAARGDGSPVEQSVIGEEKPRKVVGLLGDVRKEHELVIAEGIDLAGQESK